MAEKNPPMRDEHTDQSQHEYGPTAIAVGDGSSAGHILQIIDQYTIRQAAAVYARTVDDRNAVHEALPLSINLVDEVLVDPTNPYPDPAEAASPEVSEGDK
jgi:hypothetical protein